MLKDDLVTIAKFYPKLANDVEAKDFYQQSKKLIDEVSAYDDEIAAAIRSAVRNSGNILNTEGKFIDNLLETEYVKYLTRKSTQGKTPKGRLDWKEARDYWLFDSPLARLLKGNANKIFCWY